MTIRLATLNDILQILAFVAEVIPGMKAAGNFQWNDDYPINKYLQMTLTLTNFGWPKLQEQLRVWLP
jgi:hypothetical protein